ncbi:L-threonylcarbamoyladenylate synthase [Bacillus salitolerans]|uniref:Threonylcarbamoyl-AMP synthase n=1 Tax=Bacillus salitolerans TaxID=1437434 RepID=A0ABW4LIW5_9BACI
METKIWFVDKQMNLSTSYEQVQQAAILLQQNEVVAFPTETVYGLGGNATSNIAVERIYEAKGRPSDNPLIVHIADKSQLHLLVEDIPAYAEKLMDAFWPGPLTLVLPVIQGTVSTKVTAGLSTIAVRIPEHPVALAIIKETSLPIAAPSANLSGKPSPTKADHVWKDLNGKIAGIVDGGETGVGLESTVVDCSEGIPVILRPGGITKEQLEEVVGIVKIDPALTKREEVPKSPGMKYTHYAPKAPLWLVDGSNEYLQSLVNKQQQKGKRVGVLTTDESFEQYKANVVLSCGTRSDLSTIANKLYSILREFDDSDVDIIFSEIFPLEGVGEAVMNRLEKAAGYQRVKE